MNAQSKIERNVKLNIAQRINAAMAEVDYIQKEKKQGMNYTIVSHDAVTAKCRPILQGHGVVYYPTGLVVNQNGNRTEAVFTVRFENIDDRSDFIDVATFGYGVDAQDKGPGKAISYGVKYALLKVLGLETGDDPDTVQDARADFKPDTGERDSRPVVAPKEQPGDVSPTALGASLKLLVHNLHGCGDLGELEGLLATEDVLDVIEQCQRRAPHWFETGDGMPAEFKPLKTLIEERRRELAASEDQFNNTRTPIDAG